MELINYFINKYYNDTFYYNNGQLKINGKNISINTDNIFTNNFHLISHNDEVAVFRTISNSPLLLNNQ